MPDGMPVTVREEHHVTEDVNSAVAEYPFAEDVFDAAKWRIARDPECGALVSGTDAHPPRRVVHILPVHQTSSPGLLVRYYRLPTIAVIRLGAFLPVRRWNCCSPRRIPCDLAVVLVSHPGAIGDDGMKHPESRSEQPSPREVEIVRPDYQPSKAELEANTRVDATFEEAVQALLQPVRIRYIKRPKRR